MTQMFADVCLVALGRRRHPSPDRSATLPIGGLEHFGGREGLAELSPAEQSPRRPGAVRVVDGATPAVCFRKSGSANKGAARLARPACRGVNDPEITLGQ